MLRTMTGAIAFDTHRFVKRLTDSGFTEKQAETLAEEHVALLNDNLATKTDLADVEARLKADIEALRLATGADLAKVEAGLKADIARVEGSLKADIARVEADIARVETGLKADIARVEAGLKADIEAVKADLLKWMFGAMIAQGGLIVALVKLL